MNTQTRKIDIEDLNVKVAIAFGLAMIAFLLLLLIYLSFAK